MNRRRNLLTFFSLILLPFTVSADSATQTDWSGGPGHSGPTCDWENYFYISTDIQYSIAGSLLLPSIVEHTVDEDFLDVRAVYAVDMDGDGDIDVLGAASWDNDITWWENEDGSGTSWIEHIVDSNVYGTYSIYSEDVDGDGDMDVLSACCYADEIIWWENADGSGTSWIEHIVDNNYNCAWKVHAEDINSDGDIDVLCISSTGNITWWENVNGSGTSWTEHTIDSDFYSPQSVYAEDVDGDGDMDVLGASSSQDDIAWWENADGSGTSWIKHIVDGDFYNTKSVFAGDVDGDGDIDVLGAAFWDHDITWWENDDGSGTSWIEHIVDGEFFGAYYVYAEDVDGDGDIDVLGASLYDDITWWENDDGSGTSWIEHTVDGAFFGVAVYAEDIDGDGDMDILGASTFNNTITWWEVTNCYGNGSLESSILYIGGDSDWGSIDWVSDEPTGTSVAFQVRASDDYIEMGSWSDTLFSPCSLEGILEDYDSYLQYRSILNTTDSTITPSLDEVTFTWSPLGVEGYVEPEIFELLPVYPNPAIGSPVIQFTLPEPAAVSLTVFDLSGRLVFEKTEEEYNTGFHNVTLEDLSSGVYFCRVISGDQEDMQQFVVIEQ